MPGGVSRDVGATDLTQDRRPYVHYRIPLVNDTLTQRLTAKSPGMACLSSLILVFTAAHRASQ